ncbi:phage adaptor protein [Mesorhizobium sp. L-8-3]|uniref:phage adaptor protein n=1 Tax=Mesorhizobium sp. L-8-3 TaxID=2744522 RepID=UPI0019281482|nr:hypothetical protein [Mesorhizobium sp. L-8-3]BCH22462.1 hypothetical protein MesoLjLb_22470 [Mesorhizobium sp. L-8-3]
MAIQTLGDLKASIADWMFDRQDLAAVAGDFVTLCQADLNRVLRTRRQLTSATLTLGSDGEADIPADYLQFREVTAILNPRRVLEFVAPTYRDWAYPYKFADLPNVFTISGAKLIVRPKTSADIGFEYWAKLPEMVDETDSNWLLQEHPGLYLYGCLKHASIYIGNQGRADTMANAQAGLIDVLVADDRLGVYSRASARMSRRGP